MSDPGIEALSRKANEEEQTACPVTIVVSGNLVTGYIVGQDMFESDMSEMVEKAREQAGGQNGAADLMGGLVSSVTDALGDDESDAFVHVAVQEIMTGADAIHLGGSVFRFRADDIEGFTIGTVKTKQQ